MKDINEILEIIEGSADLRKKILEAKDRNDKSGSSMEEFADEVVAILKDSGNEVAKEDVLSFIEKNDNIELCDGDLEKVAGGCKGHGDESANASSDVAQIILC